MSPNPGDSPRRNTEISSQIGKQTKLKRNWRRNLTKEENGGDVFSSLENIAKGVTGVAGSIVAFGFVFYLFGYQIVNNYYAPFGYREFEINRSVYLSAGIIFVLAFSLPIVIPIVLVTILQNIVPKYKTTPQNFIIWLLLSMFIFYWFDRWFLEILTAEKVSIFSCLQGNTKECLYMGPHFLLATIFIVISLTASALLKGRYLLGGFLFGLIVMFILSLSSWGEVIYPKISSAYAGGKPVIMQIVISKDADEKQFSGVGIEVENRVTEELSLVDQGDDFMTVINKSGSAVKLSKALITNVLFDKSPKKTDPGVNGSAPQSATQAYP